MTKRTDLQAEVLVADTEQSLFIPADTRRVEFSTPSGFEVRVSFVQGDVVADPPEGFIVTGDERVVRILDTLRIGRFKGPIFFTADQPHTLLDVSCSSSIPITDTGSTSGGFSDGFGAGFDIGQ